VQAGPHLVIGARGPLALAKRDNVYAKFAPASSANFPAKFKDKDGQLTAWRTTPVGILYNTELVKAADIPEPRRPRRQVAQNRRDPVREHGSISLEPGAGEGREVDGLRQRTCKTETAPVGILFDRPEHDRAR
jgi:hypothetical protein